MSHMPEKTAEEAFWEAYEAYRNVEQPAWDVRMKAIKAAVETYDTMTLPAREAYEKAIQPTRDTYQNVEQPAKEIYEKAVEPDREARDNAIAAAVKAYEKAIQPAKEACEKAKIKILLVDDQYLFRQGARQLLEQEEDFAVVGEAENGLDAIRLAHKLNPDVIIMETHLSKWSVVEVTKQLKAEHPQVAILMLTNFDDEESVVGHLGAGAAGYLLKNAHSENLSQAIRFVLSGDFVAHQVVAQKLYKWASRKWASRRPPAVNSYERLTRRELEVLKLTARGMSNKDIAVELGVAVRTIKGHLTTIFSKLGISSRVEAVLEALKRGWVSIEEQKTEAEG